jgi:DNA-directed RNA polymerase specialized sigma54-like protein
MYLRQQMMKKLNFQEKCRFLEEALNVLAKEHHELEQSVASITESGTLMESFSHKSPRFYDTDDDEFQDAFDDSDPDTLVTTESIFNSPSGSVQNLILLSQDSDGQAMTTTSSNSNFESFTMTSKHSKTHSKYKRKSGKSSDDSEDDSDDTLVDTISMASSDDTYISMGGDRYKAARDKFGSNQALLKKRKKVSSKLKEFDYVIVCQWR